jgi:hypothetical protein
MNREGDAVAPLPGDAEAAVLAITLRPLAPSPGGQEVSGPYLASGDDHGRVRGLHTAHDCGGYLAALGARGLHAPE